MNIRNTFQIKVSNGDVFVYVKQLCRVQAAEKQSFEIEFKSQSDGENLTFLTAKFICNSEIILDSLLWWQNQSLVFPLSSNIV